MYQGLLCNQKRKPGQDTICIRAYFAAESVSLIRTLFRSGLRWLLVLFAFSYNDRIGIENTKINASARDAAESAVSFEYVSAYEEWSTAGIGNTFLFGKVMTSNPNLLLELLQYSLPEFHIKQIENPEREADVKLSFDAHGVRLDVITTDDQGRRIDVEMQMRDEKNIPRRMRYYEGSIDQTILEKGQNYNRLGDVVILFITPFDPFDAHGYYKYTFRNTCREDQDIVLDDGVTKVVLNAAGNKGEITPELKDFLQLVAGNADPAHYAEGSFADLLIYTQN